MVIVFGFCIFLLALGSVETAVIVGPCKDQIVIPEQPVSADYTMAIVEAAVAIIIAVAIALVYSRNEHKTQTY